MGLFDASYEKQSALLRGKILRMGQRVFTINVAEGYARSENEKGIYKPIVGMAPGTVYCPRSRNTILFLIACFDGQGIGGCVLIRELLSPERGVISKPGNVSAALGITVAKTTGRIVELPSGELRLDLDGAQDEPTVEAVETQPKGEPGISQAAIQRLMPLISAAFAKRMDGVTFQAFLEELLGHHKTEADLRAALK